MSINDFLSRFTGIQVQMDWMELAASNPEICRFKLSDRNRLGGLFTPWRTNCDGTYADGNCADATPLKVETKKFPQEVEDKIPGELAQDAGSLTVPCYCLGEAGLLILDANHRLVGLFRSEQKFELSIWAIKGPICPKILPDLAYWQK